ncbi:hypothetical protein ACNPNP_08825 [Microbacterium sp. AGC85]
MDSVSAWLGAIGGAVGAIGGVGAWIVAIRANGRSERANGLAESANDTAAKAFDLQARVDARAQEFRDVRWEGAYVEVSPDQGVFRLTNVGHTVACDVTIVLDPAESGDTERVWHFDRVEPTQHEDGPLGAQKDDVLDQYIRTRAGFEVHWISPMGASGQYSQRGQQIF